MEYMDKNERNISKGWRKGKETMGYHPVNKYICERSLTKARICNKDHLKYKYCMSGLGMP